MFQSVDQSFGHEHQIDGAVRTARYDLVVGECYYSYQMNSQLQKRCILDNERHRHSKDNTRINIGYPR